MPAHRLGHWTASTVSPILTGKKDSLLVGGINYARQIAMERSGIVDIDPDEYGFSGNRATEWGNEHEADGIARYEAEKFVDVTGQQEIASLGQWITCTPDGYIGDDGLLESKCPYTIQKHWDYLLDSDSLKGDYFDQVQFQLMVTARKWCDLISFDPRYNAPHDLVVVRIEPDLDWRVRCLDRIAQAEKVISDTLELIHS